MIDIVKKTQRTEKEYRGLDCDSSSTLKDFAKDRRKYYKKYILGEKVEDEETKASTMGRLVETLLFEDEETFDSKFFLSICPKPPEPSTNMYKFCMALLKHTMEAMDEQGAVTKSFTELATLAHAESGYKWTLDKVIQEFDKEARLYYQELRETRPFGKIVISSEDKETAERIANRLRMNDFTADIVNAYNSTDVNVFNQLQIDGFEIDGLPLKGMIDKLIVNHKTKDIYIYDLKCIWAVENFYTEYYLYQRSYIQGYVYWIAAQKFAADHGLESYTVHPPSFLVCDSINYYHPLVYNMLPQDLTDAYVGFTNKYATYEGVQQIIENLKWAKENDVWNISRENFLNKAVISIQSCRKH